MTIAWLTGTLKWRLCRSFVWAAHGEGADCSECCSTTDCDCWPADSKPSKNQPLMKGWTQVTSQSRTDNLDSQIYGSVSPAPSLSGFCRSWNWRNEKGKKKKPKNARALAISFTDSLKTPFSPSLVETKAWCCEVSSSAAHSEDVWHSCPTRTVLVVSTQSARKKKHHCNGKLWKAYMKSNWPCSGFYWTHKREYKWAITSVGERGRISPSKMQRWPWFIRWHHHAAPLGAKKEILLHHCQLKRTNKNHFVPEKQNW